MPIAGTRLLREWQGVEHTVTVLTEDYEYQGRPYRSLSAIARAITGTRWNGCVFFGLKNHGAQHDRGPEGKPIRKLRCAVYTRKTTEEGLDKEFNSPRRPARGLRGLHRQPAAEGWALVRDRYDDGGFSGGTLERPALKRLLADIEAGRSTSSWSTRSTGCPAR